MGGYGGYVTDELRVLIDYTVQDCDYKIDFNRNDQRNHCNKICDEDLSNLFVHCVAPPGLHRLVHELLERFETREYATPIIQRTHTLAKPMGRPGNFRAMHSHDCGTGTICPFTQVNRLYQIQRNRDFEKCWRGATHRDASHHFLAEGIDTLDISDLHVGLKGSDGRGDKLRGRACDF